MKRWSTSALTTLQMCGEIFRRRYIEGDRMPGGTTMKRGLAVDKAVTESLAAKKATGEQPIPEANKDIAADEFERSWSEGVWFSPDERKEDPKKIKAATKDTAVDLAGLHARTLGREIRPVEIQHKVEIQPTGTDLTIIGYMDIIDLSADPLFGVQKIGSFPSQPVEVIRDTKTKEKAPNQADADESQQLTMYALLRMAETGRMPDALSLDVLWKTPAKGDLKHVVLPTRRTKADFGPLVGRINEGIRAVERGVFIPASEGHWKCSARWCEYWETCPYVRHPESIQV